MARRRTNHGQSASAGSLAVRTVAAIVPAEQLRLTRVQLVWPRIAPGRLGRVAWPAAVHGDTLTVHVVDNQWLHELSYMRDELLERINTEARQAEVAELRLRVAPLPDPWPEPPVLPDPEVPALPDEPSAETLAALKEVADPGLRQTIANARMALSHRLRR